MTRDELLERYATGERDFRGADLVNADLAGADLAGANLGGAHLEWADLEWANLEGANLRLANLKGANLRCANLKGTNLRRTPLEGANLRGANLSGADLVGAKFEGANLGGVNLEGSNLAGADLKGAYLKGANLPGLPAVPDLDRQIFAAVSQRGAGLDMDKWHTCLTTHCLAGWAIHLAGKAGYKLEAAVGPEVAGTLIYHASTGFVPNFFATDEKALDDLKVRAGRSE